jgi:chromate transporter
MDWKLQRDIFIGFLRSGLLGYGGGPSAIPLVHREVVDNYKWMKSEEFSDVLALGNTLPGPIATKMAGYIGYRLAGITGMIVALIATVLPTVLGMIALVSLLTTFKESPIVEGMTKAVTPVIAMMLAVMTWQFVSQSRKELGWSGAIVMCGASLLLYSWLGVHPAIIIGVLLVSALVGNPFRGRSKP